MLFGLYQSALRNRRRPCISEILAQALLSSYLCATRAPSQLEASHSSSMSGRASSFIKAFCQNLWCLLSILGLSRYAVIQITSFTILDTK